MTKPSPQLPLCEHFNQFVKAAATGRRLTNSGKRIAKGTIINYMFVRIPPAKYTLFKKSFASNFAFTYNGGVTVP